MNKFDKRYKEFYSNINADKKLKESILDNVINKNVTKKSPLSKIIVYTTCSILIVLLAGITFVSALKIEKVVKSYLVDKKLEVPAELDKDNKDVYSCTIYSPVNDEINVNSKFDENRVNISGEELEKELGIHILSNDQFPDNNYEIIRVKRENEKISLVSLARSTIVINDELQGTLDMKISFITDHYSEKQAAPKTLFRKLDCVDENFEKVTTKKGIDIYFYIRDSENISQMNNNQEIHTISAIFIYDNIGYVIQYRYLTREEVIEFVESLE